MADRARTFYQDLSINTALGICVLGNRVIVSSAPGVFLLTDTDGDDVADKRELLFSCDPKQADHDHAMHAFVFGPDGKLYFNFGNAGGYLRRPPAGMKDLPLHGKSRAFGPEYASPATMEVYTRDSTASCGWPFKVGERVTVGVTVVDGRYHASACAMQRQKGNGVFEAFAPDVGKPE